MKKWILNNKKSIFAFVLGICLATTTVSAAIMIAANQVSFSSSETSQTTVQGALDELYDYLNTTKINVSYDASTSKITYDFLDSSGIAGYAFTTTDSTPSSFTDKGATQTSKYVDKSGDIYLWVKNNNGKITSKKVTVVEKVLQNNLYVTSATESKNLYAGEPFSDCGWQWDGAACFSDTKLPTTITEIFHWYVDNNVDFYGDIYFRFYPQGKDTYFLMDYDNGRESDDSFEWILNGDGDELCSDTESGIVKKTIKCSLGNTNISTYDLDITAYGNSSISGDITLSNFRFVYYDVVVS